MTPDERKILEEAEQQAFDTAQAFYDVPTSGIRPPPSIDETETTLDPQLFGYEFGAQPTTEAGPTSSSGGEPPPACPDTVTVTFSGIFFFCCLQPNPGDDYYNFTDVSLNDVPYVSSPKADCGGLDCFWPLTSGPTVTKNLFDPGDSSCNTVLSSSTQNVNFAVGKLGTTWYVFARADSGELLFLASGTDPSSLVSSIFCQVATEFDSPLIECAYGAPITVDVPTAFGTCAVTF